MFRGPFRTIYLLLALAAIIPMSFDTASAQDDSNCGYLQGYDRYYVPLDSLTIARDETAVYHLIFQDLSGPDCGWSDGNDMQVVTVDPLPDFITRRNGSSTPFYIDPRVGGGAQDMIFEINPTLTGHIDEYNIRFEVYYHDRWVSTQALYVKVLPQPDDYCSDQYPIPLWEPPYSAGDMNTIWFKPLCDPAASYGICYWDSLYPDELLGCLEMKSEIVRGDTLYWRTVSNLEEGIVYKYAVQASLNGRTYTTLEPDWVSSIQDASPPDPVTTLTAVPLSGGRVQLTWKSVSDALSGVSRYTINRKYDNDVWVPIYDFVLGEGQQSEPSYTKILNLTDGYDNYRWVSFMVRAVDDVGNGIAGNPAGPIRPDAVSPLQPAATIDRLINGRYSRGIDFYMSALSTGARDTAASEMRFQVAVELDEVDFQNPFYDGDWVGYVGGAADSVSLQVPSWADGKQFWLRAQARDEVHNESKWSLPVSALVDAEPPYRVANPTAEPVWLGDHYGWQLEWDESGDNVSGVMEYRIYWKLGPLERRLLAPLPAGVVSYLHDLEHAGQEQPITYWITAVDSVGYESRLSDAVPAEPRPAPVLSFCDEAQVTDCGIGASTRHPALEVCWAGYPAQQDVKTWHLSVTGPDEIDRQFNLDSTTTRSIVDLSLEGTYRIGLKAEFTDNGPSPDSEELVVRLDTRPPSAVDDLLVNAVAGGYELQWTRPDDPSGTMGYTIECLFGQEVPFGDWSLDSAADTLRAFISYDPSVDGALVPDEPFVTYLDYSFAVRGFDCLDNIGDYESRVMSCCIRAPRLEWPEIVTTGDDHQVWSFAFTPPEPMQAEQRYTYFRVFFDGEIIEDLGGYLNQVDPFVFDPSVYGHGAGNYGFTIREESLDDGVDCTESAWSDTILVPYGIDIEPVEVFQVLALPLESETAPASATIRWTYPHELYAFSHFDFFIAEGDTLQLVRELGAPSYHQLLEGLDPGALYDLKIRAVYGFGHVSEWTDCPLDFDPAWSFTPWVAPFEPATNRGDSLEVRCEREDLPVLAGVERQKVQVSLTPDFSEGFGTIETPWFPAGESHMLSLDGLGELGHGTVLYARARATFQWEDDDADYETPWSTDYPDLPIPTVTIDLVNPNQTEHVWYETFAHPGPVEGLLDVRLTWVAPDDPNKDVATRFDVICYGETVAAGLSDTTFVHSAQLYSELAGKYYVVIPYDAAGNSQPERNLVLTILADGLTPAPTLSELTVNSAVMSGMGTPLPAFYRAECSYESDYLGTPLMRLMPQEAQIGPSQVNGAVQTLEFATDSDFRSHDTIYYHACTTRFVGTADQGLLTRESPWSAAVPYHASGNAGVDGLPIAFGIDQNVPNPFNPSTQIAFRLPRTSHVSLRIYDLRGQLVRTLVDGGFEAGEHAVVWNGRNDRGGHASDGVYFYRIVADGYERTRKMILIR